MSAPRYTTMIDRTAKMIFAYLNSDFIEYPLTVIPIPAASIIVVRTKYDVVIAVLA